MSMDVVHTNKRIDAYCFPYFFSTRQYTLKTCIYCWTLSSELSTKTSLCSHPNNPSQLSLVLPFDQKTKVPYYAYELSFLFTDAQFIEQPPSGKLFVPANKQVTLNCSVEEQYNVDWRIVIPPRSCGHEASWNSGFFTDLFGFSFEGLSTSRSTVSLKFASKWMPELWA